MIRNFITIEIQLHFLDISPVSRLSASPSDPIKYQSDKLFRYNRV